MVLFSYCILYLFRAGVSSSFNYSTASFFFSSCMLPPDELSSFGVHCGVGKAAGVTDTGLTAIPELTGSRIHLSVSVESLIRFGDSSTQTVYIANYRFLG